MFITIWRESMRVKIVVEDDDGSIYEAEANMIKSQKVLIKDFKNKTVSKKHPEKHTIDYDLPIRAFIKQYAKELSGSRKFTLLVAYFAKGDEKGNVKIDLIEKNWKKMQAKHLLGIKYSLAHSGRAIEEGWLNTKSRGEYYLMPKWKEIFSNG
jgi:hypothetical protein